MNKEPTIREPESGVDDIRREFSTPKPCAPYCTVGCVHRVSTMDFWRSPQTPVRGGESSVVSR